MKNRILTLFFLTLALLATAQESPEYEKRNLKINDTSFDYYITDIQSKSVVIIFHDWFGISDLSFDMMKRLNEEGFDVQVLDLYKGKSAKNNQEARQLMNSIDMANVPQYIDSVIQSAEKSYEKVFIWGFSLGTQFAAMSAIRNNTIINGLVLFYGNVPQRAEQLDQMTFPSLMVMGSKDNPAGAIQFFNALNKEKTYASLYIYPNARHAFAQKLFNEGRNYDEEAIKSTFQVAYDFLSRDQ